MFLYCDVSTKAEHSGCNVLRTFYKCLWRFYKHQRRSSINIPIVFHDNKGRTFSSQHLKNGLQMLSRPQMILIKRSCNVISKHKVEHSACNVLRMLFREHIIERSSHNVLWQQKKNVLKPTFKTCFPDIIEPSQCFLYGMF